MKAQAEAAPPEQLAPAMPEPARVDCLLRAGAMRAYLAANLSPDDPDASCHVLDAKYAPGEQCTVLYALGQRLVSGRLRLDGAEPGLRLWVFPDDPALPGVRLLAAPDALRETLGEALGDALRAALPEGARVRGCRAALLRYRPHRRATFLLGVRVGGQLVRFVAKAYHDEETAAAVYAESGRLARLLPDRGIVLAEPVAFLPAPRLVLQRVVEGQPLDQLLGSRRGGGRDLRRGVREAGAALAVLHSAPEVSNRERPVGAELARIARRAAAVNSIDPDLGARLAAVAEDLDRRGRDLPAAARGLVHGDCKPSQFLVRAGSVALLDFDHCAVADPASDVGTFLASLRQRLPEAHDLAADFLAAYQQIAGSGATPRARWYEAVALLRKALRAFARSPRSPLPAALADEARRCLTATEQRAA